jgi:biotin-(acetyl-CoA carboxylase) ligase
MGDEVISGTATGIDGDGALLLEAEDGVIRRVLAGDVIPLGD